MRTKTPLTDREFDLLMKRILSVPYDRSPFVWGGEEYSVDPRLATLFIWATACHPTVLAHPKRCQLVVLENGDIHFYRPKKEREDDLAEIVIPPPPAISGWYRQFVDDLPDLESNCKPTERVYRYRKDYPERGAKKGDPTGEVGSRCSCSEFYSLLVMRTLRAVGLDGGSARGLRHTRAAQIYDETRNVNYLRRKTGTSLRVALGYADRIEDRQMDDRIRDGSV
jgi:hypothetical protein